MMTVCFAIVAGRAREYRASDRAGQRPPVLIRNAARGRMRAGGAWTIHTDA
jgi:hypothetical protein